MSKEEKSSNKQESPLLTEQEKPSVSQALKQNCPPPALGECLSELSLLWQSHLLKNNKQELWIWSLLWKICRHYKDIFTKDLLNTIGLCVA